jgi:hypothetical protein
LEPPPRDKLEEALEFSGDAKFLRLYDALQDPAYRNTNLSALRRRFGVSLKDLVKLWRDYNVLVATVFMRRPWRTRRRSMRVVAVCTAQMPIKKQTRVASGQDF